MHSAVYGPAIRMKQIASEPKLPESWCPAPWAHIAMRFDGRYSICAFGQTVDINDDGEIDRDQLAALKSAMLRGERLPACERCWFQERNGQRSHRQTLITQFEGKIDPWLLENPSYSPRFSYDLSLGNRCNQKCRICNPSNSTSWFKDASIFDYASWTHLSGHRTVRSAMDDIPKIINMMKATDEWLDVELKGGEPLYMPEVRELLSKMIEHRLNERTHHLKIITNGTISDDGILSLLSDFPTVIFSISIDAVGRLYEYTRSGGLSWDDARRSWDKLRVLPNVDEIMISNTIYIYNVFDQSNLSQWVNEHFGFGTNMANVCLRRPLYLGLKILPDDIKQLACDALIDHPDQIQADVLRQILLSEVHEDDVRPIGGNQKPYSAWEVWQRTNWLRNKFRDYTLRLDRVRGESCASLVPELMSLLR